MSVYVNRVLNLKQIKAIGFDMDYTLVEYHTQELERFVYQQIIKKLIEYKNYPEAILNLKFNFDQVIQGLVIDKKQGNILKVSRFSKVKKALHGTREMDYKETQKVYKKMVIDLNASEFQSLDTSFSISNGVLFAQLVDLRDQGHEIPGYLQLAIDIKEMIDLVHRDGTLKDEVKKNIKKYIKQNPNTVKLLERYKRDGKTLLLITNSDYSYSKTLMEFAFNPFLEDHQDWKELFQVIVTLSMKPSFFTNNHQFLKIDPKNGLMSNYEGDISKGIYQGGNAQKLQNALQLDGDEILYLGDHIFGDVVSIKKTCNWRTALVLSPLKEELESLKKSNPIQLKIDQLMEEKIIIEKNIKQKNSQVDYKKLEDLNTQISKLLLELQQSFNPYWGELMRAGAEESRFADQVEKYACIYMEKVSHLDEYSSKSYFRPMKRQLPHEIN